VVCAVAICGAAAYASYRDVQPHRVPVPAAMQPNCTTDRWDYPASKSGKPGVPEYHIGLGGKDVQPWNFCPDWKRRRTQEMT
jgi:hypothetical protein